MGVVAVKEDAMPKPLVTDELWELVEPLLPKHEPSRKGGKPRVPDRVCLTGILFVLKTGIPWEDFPCEMGCCGMTLWNRLDEWREAGVWDALHRLLLDKLRAAGEIDFARVVVDSARLNAQHPAAAAEASWVVATDLAEALARNGTPFHQAHNIVGRLVLESVRGGKKPSDWDADTLAKFAPEFTAEMAKLLQPSEGMKTREIRGGTGPKAVAAALQDAEKRLAALRK